MTRIGPEINVPSIRNKTESICFRLFLDRYVSPTTTGRIDINRKKSYLNNGPNVARPMKNFDESILTTSGQIVSPENITKTDIPTITIYEIKSANLVLRDICVLAVKNNVITK